MHLTEKEIERFYGIWFSLLHFVNQHHKIVSSFPKIWRNANVSPEIALPIRNVLWEDDTLLETFIADNPAKLNTDNLALVNSWKNRVSDSFFIFRHLKKHTIFIDNSSPPIGYGVHGITSSLEEVIGSYLPIYAQAVLLPFEDHIIYDSLLSSYPIYFGSGYKRSLKDTYRDIQERGGVITTLPNNYNDRNRVQAGNKKVLAAFQKSLGSSGLSPKMILEHTENISDFANEFLVKQTPSVFLLDTTEKTIEIYRKLRNDNINLVSFKRFLRFLRDTGRMEWDKVEHLLQFLKRK